MPTPLKYNLLTIQKKIIMEVERIRETRTRYTVSDKHDKKDKLEIDVTVKSIYIQTIYIHEPDIIELDKSEAIALFEAILKDLKKK